MVRFLGVLSLAVLIYYCLHVSFTIKSDHTSVVVIGGCLVDFIAEPKDEMVLHTSNPGTVAQSWGGVARNIANAVAIHKGDKNSVLFISVLGNDLIADSFYTKHREIFDTSGVQKLSGNTGMYIALSNSNVDHDLFVAIAQTDILSELTPAYLSQYKERMQSAKIVAVDGNLSEDTLFSIGQLCEEGGVPLWFEPTSLAKSTKILKSGVSPSSITFVSPNIYELFEMSSWVQTNIIPVEISSYKNLITAPFEKEKEASLYLLVAGIRYIVVTMGENGVLLGEKKNEQITFTHFPAIQVERITQVNGAGDALARMCHFYFVDIRFIIFGSNASHK